LLHLGHVYRIHFHFRDVPQCYLKWRIREFRNTNRIIWVSTRKRRDELLCCDRSATWSAHRYRRCKRCGRKIVGFAAQIRMLDEEAARRNGEPVPRRGRSCA
jgi:hypothetical protein